MKNIFAHKQHMGDIVEGITNELPEAVDDPAADKEILN